MPSFGASRGDKGLKPGDRLFLELEYGHAFQLWEVQSGLVFALNNLL